MIRLAAVAMAKGQPNATGERGVIVTLHRSRPTTADRAGCLFGF